ncbi:MAG: calcium-binding protein [Actinomycetota bacterium]
MQHSMSWRRSDARRVLGVIAVGTIVAATLAATAPEAHAARPKCFGRRATIVGTGGDNQLQGTNRSDVIVARAGNDTIDARGGRDFVCAGRGSFDVVFARGGNDKIAGQRGLDVVFPGAGDDVVNGGPGEDFVTYEGSSVPVDADLSTGVITAAGRDRVRSVNGVGGGESDDRLVGTDSSEVLFGNGGNDVVIGNGGDDFLNSGAGNDTVEGGDGIDGLDLLTAHGGPAIGDDVFATSGAVVDMSSGTVTGGTDVGQDTFTGIEDVGATLGDDTITGTADSNFVLVFDGNDNVQSMAGDDVIFPGDGDDIVDGGDDLDGVDYFDSDVTQPGQLGPVTVDLQAGSATGLGTDVLSGFEAAGGTSLDDTLIGSSRPEFVLLGYDGSDEISGGPGDDFLDGDIFFFGFPENLPGTDALDGGPGTDTCLGGESADNCEVLEPPAAAARAALFERSARLRTLYERTSL